MKGRAGQGGPEAPPPTREDVLRFIAGEGAGMGRRELLDALAPVRGHKAAVKALLRDLSREGVIGRRAKRAERAAKRPEAREPRPDGVRVTVIDLTEIDANGDLIGSLPDDPELKILLPAEALDRQAPGVGDRVLARLTPTGPNRAEARLIRVLPKRPRAVVGVIETAGDGYWLRPSDRRIKDEFVLSPRDLGDAARGDLVLAEIVHSRRLGPTRAKVTQRIGRPDQPQVVSTMTALALGLPLEFPAEVREAAERARPVALGKREDLRALPLVTIDGEDARDFDDAVWAAPDEDKANPGGYRLTVAIADVAHYVRPGDPLDQEARKRGNSVYFPDRAIPMLPEQLSNDLCSLRPDEDRACLTCHMTLDNRGEVVAWRFTRALMRSRARLTYTRVQAARDGVTDEQTAALLEPVIAPLYGAFELLLAARRRRGTIELELPERKIVFNPDGTPKTIEPRSRLASHMLIEEMMIAANVAAARTIHDAKRPGLYRVHDKPDPSKLEALAQFLERLGVPWSRTATRPGDFTRLLERLAERDMKEMVSSLVLRSQAQAVYAPKNIGHFGLHLRLYTHFTSPIRRYSDLIVHRVLISLLGLGDDGLPAGVDFEQLASLGEHLSRTERRAMEAERRAFERFVSLYLADRVGTVFEGRITSVVYFGLFVTLDDTGAEGLVPVSGLGDEAFLLDERHYALIGQRSGEAFGMGDRVKVTLVEADAIQGSLLFRLEEHVRGHGAELARGAWKKSGGRMQGGRPRRGPPPRRRR
ncbi:MAG: ribonuclease R [Geminicoccaceae bacterium]